MSSPVYELFVRAMVEGKQVWCVFRGRRRVLSLIILGHRNGEEVALSWQMAGESTGPLPPEGAWRNITLSEVSDVDLKKGELKTGKREHGQQRWVST